MDIYKVTVRCLKVDPKHGADSFTIGKVYDGWEYTTGSSVTGPSVYVVDDVGESSALFDDEFEVVDIIQKERGEDE